MHGIKIEQIAGHDLRTQTAQCLRALVLSSHHRPHRLALLQLQFGDRASYRPDAARRASNQNGICHVSLACVHFNLRQIC
jgi:hypothetical protein